MMGLSHNHKQRCWQLAPLTERKPSMEKSLWKFK
uniref:Uncharacterized protein n=1 Tax=Anguilla anguilla TaxID=7936 RepID=A0A0E9UK52_ANGAN